MKSILTTSLLIIALLPTAMTATCSGQAAAQQSGGLEPRTPDQVVAFLDSKLHLSPDQKAQIEPIIADRQQKLRDLRDSSSPRLRKAHKLKSIFQDSDKKIEAVLTDQQKPEYQQIREQMKEQIRDRIQNGSNYQ
jgi:hypothetical protein